MLLFWGGFWQSNTSVYALYNDGPPDLIYIQKYGHTKGTVQSGGRNLLHYSFFISRLLFIIVITQQDSSGFIPKDFTVSRKYSSTVTAIVFSSLCGHMCKLR